MSAIASQIAALVPLLALFGTGVAWWVARIDKRVGAAEAKVGECEAHREEDQDLIARLTFEVRRDGMAIRMLCGELHEISPGNPTLTNVAAVLRQRYDPTLAMPDDFAELLAKIEKGPGA